MSEPNDRILGVLGGMGPLASAQFMLRLTLLTPASRDQDHIPAILWSDPRIPDRIAGRAGTGPDPLPWLLRGIDGLRQAGCAAIVIPCNTAHAWYPDMVAHSPLPILHIVDAAAADLDALHLDSRRIGVMGTVPTLQLRLYQDRLAALGWDCIQPTDDEMRRLILPAIAQVKVNRLAEAHPPLAEAVNLLAARGASAVVLGCTEIPLGILAGPSDALRVPVIDTIDSLARASIRWARPTAEG
ncbi:aspartate/glutamate racemase family protein [Rhodopila sp.]|uniref:aspartate/glutamate racemase family protein n=1 Tax=Rhodopila sp. TaxID=2480087 RepID=UPI002B928C5B|nr:amino acid racemase [Rhodopila sp.]HVZ08453.1 amino acid racemase [Rhodopila sp.]